MSPCVLRNMVWYFAKWYFTLLFEMPHYTRWNIAWWNFVSCSLFKDCELVEHFSKRTFRFVWKRYSTASCTYCFPNDGGLTGISLSILYKNRPLAQSAHMAPNQTFRDTSCTVGLPKQRQVKVDWYELLWFEVPLCNLRSRMVNFVPCDLIMQTA